jgi:hypothetical protein
VAGRLREGVEGGGFHFDAEYAGCAMPRDVSCCLAERRVGRPGAAVQDGWCVGDVEVRERVEKVGVKVAPACRREVVEAGAFVAERSFDDDE